MESRFQFTIPYCCLWPVPTYLSSHLTPCRTFHICVWILQITCPSSTLFLITAYESINISIKFKLKKKEEGRMKRERDREGSLCVCTVRPTDPKWTCPMLGSLLSRTCGCLWLAPPPELAEGSCPHSVPPLPNHARIAKALEFPAETASRPGWSLHRPFPFPGSRVDLTTPAVCAP